MKGLILTFLLSALNLEAALPSFPRDTLPAGGGDIILTFIGHGSLAITHSGVQIQVDPFGKLADYGLFPKADLVLVTHDHFDHFDPDAIAAARKPGAPVVLTAKCAARFAGGTVLRNGEVKTLSGIEIKAVPAYNLLHKRDDGTPFHPKGDGNGYILTIGGKKIYIAGDTENIPEMAKLDPVDVAFLPANLPYTMTPEMAADAAANIRPAILYPYHYGDTDTKALLAVFAKIKGVETRLRPMK